MQRKIKKPLKLLVFGILITSFGLSAENKRGPFFFEFTYGQGFKYLNATPRKMDEDGNIMDREVKFDNVNIIGPYTTEFGTPEDKIASVYAFNNAPKPKISGQNTSFLFEYLIKSKYGLGFSLNNAEFQASNLSYPKLSYLLDLGILRSISPAALYIPIDQLVKSEIVLPYFTYQDNSFLRIRTFNFHFAYHFLENSAFDPYIRLSAGYGKDSINNTKIIQTSIIIGSRYFILERAYLLGELTGNNYDAYAETGGSGFHNFLDVKQRHIWSFQEYSAKFGIGFNL
ncbi:hypothetical protein LFX25_20350 [Leptospira sp. FAT2]|uniref:hypothetical protein n=1 Tax=Leptospira sanjuanensis TaxID=2879643 RepID=UPI001EE7B12E|nr:hypothetical protein [Leptospira sanjuanensis]MCG6169789.1 hypothetical protein [Leptospira sanjuanensis]MCG6195597.1 hypothetical protein [Leptospira sanjuanensis]